MEKEKRVAEPVLSVTELCKSLELVLKNNFSPSLRVAGEVADFFLAQSGHRYFSLKDENASVACIVWAGAHFPFKYALKNGLKIEVWASFRLYAVRGQLQLIVQNAQPLGAGEQSAELARLKEKLRQEGLFSDSCKKALPRFIRRVALVTSEKGAALKDMLARFESVPSLCFVVFDSLVQGDWAVPSLVAALKKADSMRFDVLILARGGGSTADLSVFDNEAVVRAFADLKTPTISGIGHEVDVSLCDWVADCRASTPTDAARRVVEIHSAIWRDLALYQDHIFSLMNEHLRQHFERLRVLKGHFKILSPAERHLRQQEKLTDFQLRLPRLVRARLEVALHHFNFYQEQLPRLMGERLQQNREKLHAYRELFRLIHPKNLLKKGYALVLDENKELIFDARCVKKGALLHIQTANALLSVRVEHILEESQ